MRVIAVLLVFSGVVLLVASFVVFILELMKVIHIHKNQTESNSDTEGMKGIEGNGKHGKNI